MAALDMGILLLWIRDSFEWFVSIIILHILQIEKSKILIILQWFLDESPGLTNPGNLCYHMAQQCFISETAAKYRVKKMQKLCGADDREELAEMMRNIL